MQALIDVILPVFMVLGFGYIAVWKGLFADSGVDGLMKYTQNFAIPCLLFRAISTLDLGANFDPKLLLSFYAGAIAGFAIGLLGGRYVFKRSWQDSVAFGFCGLFSNSALLGLPITERAYGVDALTANYTIIALHSPFCYGVGITAMEVVRNRGNGILATTRSVLRSMFRNALVIGIAMGFLANVSGLALPSALADAVDLVAQSALPVALFAVGGVLYRYRPEGDIRAILFVVSLSLLLHPVITFSLGHHFELQQAGLRSAVLTAAMAPGINCYVFANMYGAARRVAASAVLFGTAFSAGSIWVWLAVLP
jgi:predicted permease